MQKGSIVQVGKSQYTVEDIIYCECGKLHLKIKEHNYPISEYKICQCGRNVNASFNTYEERIFKFVSDPKLELPDILKKLNL
jgi:hypothetical protein